MTAPPAFFVPEETLLFHAGVLIGNGPRGIEDKTEVTEARYLRASRGKRCECDLGRHVADENILREGAASQSAEGCVEATAAGLVSGRDLGGCLVAARMEVDTQLDL